MKTKAWFLSPIYIGGLLAGFGVGVILTNALLSTAEHRVVVGAVPYIASWLCLAAGGLVGRAAHRNAAV